ncbi:MAG: CatB-related O-acetyltransferase [Pseudomonadota bacterium]
MIGPDPDALHPLPNAHRVVFLRPLAKGRPNVEIGRYTYYDDPDETLSFFERNVLHHYPSDGDRLRIGPFTAIAAHVTFIMNGAAHSNSGVSTYPFEIFGNGWEAGHMPEFYPSRGDTIIGADVWIGHDALILPGVTVGPGAVIGARSVVSRDVAPYTVVAGNPAEVVRHRYDASTTADLVALAWWDWPVERIAAHLPAIRQGDVAALSQ